MSDIELAVTRVKALEALLEQALGATGKGLHEKVSSVQPRLPPALVKRLRFVATVRNKIVHEADYKQIDDRAGFTRACDEAEAELRAMLRPATRGRGFGRVLVGLAILVVIAAIVWKLIV
jgi:hypothetical protein